MWIDCNLLIKSYLEKYFLLLAVYYLSAFCLVSGLSFYQSLIFCQINKSVSGSLILR